MKFVGYGTHWPKHVASTGSSFLGNLPVYLRYFIDRESPVSALFANHLNLPFQQSLSSCRNGIYCIIASKTRNKASYSVLAFFLVGAGGVRGACCLPTGFPQIWGAIYIWGDPQLTEPIKVNGHQVRVTLNLVYALEQLRHASDTVELWVDALCINQGNARTCEQPNQGFAPTERIRCYVRD
jgi:hypothetical protein